ncbi:hypothetical protein BGP84_16290 [Pseudomonas putida]|uniref:Uncharacterized protein n=1 Tax=Pseudomonas putida TaxID=303 RepID=A0A2S3X6P5_PSEPU|nr:hypothetical protein BGP84_16290 [Pseudomonas putida]POG14870.1 hypothetical protein BGP85_01435 [Pseudomonas putida]
MIDISTWSSGLKLIILLSPFIVGLPGLVMGAYITLSKDYGTVCSSITSNPYLELLKSTWGNGSFKWRWMLVGAVGGLVSFPWLVLRTGKLDVEELKAFPLSLKRRLVISSWLTVSGFVGMAAMWAFVQFK